MANRRMLSFRVLIVLCSALLVCGFVLYRGNVLTRPANPAVTTANQTTQGPSAAEDPTFFYGSKSARPFSPQDVSGDSSQVMSGSKSAAISVPGDFQAPPLIALPPAATKPADQQPKP